MDEKKKWVLPPRSDGNVLRGLGQGRRERCSPGRLQRKDRFSCKQLQSCQRNEHPPCRQQQHGGPRRRPGAELRRGAGGPSELPAPMALLPGGDRIEQKHGVKPVPGTLDV